MQIKPLAVIYDRENIREDSKQYLNLIKKEISVIELSIEEIENIEEKANYIYLKSKDRQKDNEIKEYLKKLEQRKQLRNIEYDKKGLSITAEAIIKTLKQFGNVKDKLITIVNQSEEVGKSLAVELIKTGHNVININSKLEPEKVQSLCDISKILIIAAEEFKYNLANSTTLNKIIIDISNSTKTLSIRRIPTIEVLKERLMKQ